MKHIITLFTFTLFFSASAISQQTGWFWQNPLPQGNSLFDIHVFNSDTAIAVGNFGTVIKTTDGGANWSVQYNASGITYPLYSVHFVDINTGWVVGGSGKIWKTTNGGANWSSQPWATTQNLSSVQFIDINTGWVVGGSGKILKTTNGGTDWFFQTSGTTQDLWSVHFIDMNTGWAVGSNGTILKTTNGGMSWFSQSSGTTQSLLSVHFIDMNTGWVVGEGGKTLKTTNGGTNWSSQTIITTNWLHSVQFVDSNTGWAVGNGGTILKTVNGGTNWSSQTSGTTQDLWSVYFVDSNTGWAVGTHGTILKTTNRGTNWSSQSSGTINDLFSVYFTDSNTGWAVGDIGKILKTTNGGTNWNSQASATPYRLYSVQFVNVNTGWAVGDFNIIKTTNGGANWTKSSGTSIFLFSVQFVDSNTGWAVGSGGTIFKTTNGGTNWSSQTSGTTQSLWSVHFIDMNTGWTVGRGGKILKTTNGGTNWSSQTSGTTNDMFSIHFIDSNTGWAVGGVGTILKYIDTLPIPNAPTNLTATDLGNHKVRLNWQDNANNETDYTIYRFNIPIANLSANTTSYVDSVSNDGNYSYKVRAVNSSGVSSFSNWIYIFINVAPPIAPKNLVATAGDKQVILKWNKNTETDFLRYRIFIGTSPNPTTKVDSTIGGVSDTTKTITGLTNGVTYYFRITAIDNGLKQSSYSNEVSATPKDITPPSIPKNLVAIAGDKQVTLKWRKNTESDLLRYRIFIGTSSNPTTKVDSTASGNDTTKVITGLTNGTKYYFSITAVDKALNESGYSNEVNAMPTVTSIYTRKIGIPKLFAISQNYPNPFNPVTTIEYDLPYNSEVSIKVYDILGKEIRTLVNGKIQAGYHYVIWDGKNDYGKEVSSGIYFYRFEAEGYVETKKLLYLK